MSFIFETSAPLFERTEHILVILTIKPTKLAIRHLVQRFQQQGSVGDSPRTGRPRSVRMEENIERSQESVHEEPGTSIQRRSR